MGAPSSREGEEPRPKTGAVLTHAVPTVAVCSSRGICLTYKQTNVETMQYCNRARRLQYSEYNRRARLANGSVADVLRRHTPSRRREPPAPAASPAAGAAIMRFRGRWNDSG